MSVKTAERLLLVKAPSRGPSLKQRKCGGLFFPTRLIAGGLPCSEPPWQLFTAGLVLLQMVIWSLLSDPGVFAQALLEWLTGGNVCFSGRFSAERHTLVPLFEGPEPRSGMLFSWIRFSKLLLRRLEVDFGFLGVDDAAFAGFAKEEANEMMD